MQVDPRYDDVVAEVKTFLAEHAAAAAEAGVTEIWVDPGIGFGKTDEHNLSLLRHLDEVVALGYPVRRRHQSQGLPRTAAGRIRRGGRTRTHR